MTLTIRTAGQTVRVERPVAPVEFTIGEYRVTVEPVDGKGQDVQASGAWDKATGTAP